MLYFFYVSSKNRTVRLAKCPQGDLILCKDLLCFAHNPYSVHEISICERYNNKKEKNYLRRQTRILYRPIMSAIVKPWRAGAGLGGGSGGCGVGALGGLATSLSRSLLRSLSLLCSISARSLSRSRSWSSSSTLEGPGELILRR